MSLYSELSHEELEKEFSAVRKEYERAEIAVIKFEAVDIITTSGYTGVVPGDGIVLPEDTFG